MSRRVVLMIAAMVLTALVSQAQQVTSKLTAFPDFRPATVYMADGKVVKVGLANIFLRNSSLLFMSGKGEVMEAKARGLLRVDFDSCSYYLVDSLLVTAVDTLGGDGIYRARVIDMAAYRQMVRNNRVITSLDLADVISFSSVELSPEEGLPLVPVFYFRLGGQFVLAHERHLKRHLDKEKRRRMEAIMAKPGFSWTDEISLVEMLKMIR